MNAIRQLFDAAVSSLTLVAALGMLPLTVLHANPLTVSGVREKAEKGDADAQYMLATFYLGYGFDKLAIEDKTKRLLPHSPGDAIKWFTKAADQGHVGSMSQLAMLYGGDYEYTNLVLELKYLRMSVAGGDGASAFTLGLKYELGEHVPKDVIESTAWYLICAEFNSDMSRLALNNVDNAVKLGAISREQLARARNRASAIKQSLPDLRSLRSTPGQGASQYFLRFSHEEFNGPAAWQAWLKKSYDGRVIQVATKLQLEELEKAKADFIQAGKEVEDILTNRRGTLEERYERFQRADNLARERFDRLTLLVVRYGI